MELTEQQKEKIDNDIIQELHSFIKKKGLKLNESTNVSDHKMLKRLDNSIEFLKTTSMRLNAESQEELDAMVKYYNNRIQIMGEVLAKKYE